MSPVNEEYVEEHPPEPTRVERVINVVREPRTSTPTITVLTIVLFVVVAAVLGLTPMPFGAIGFAALICLAIERANVHRR